jgi:D-alanyl-D-alanine carboxypeptidase
VLLLLSLFTAIAILPHRQGAIRRKRYPRREFTYRGLVRVFRILGLIALLIPQMSAQAVKPRKVAAKRLLQLVEVFNANDWNAFQASYTASFVSVPPDVPLGRKFFRQRTAGLDPRKLEKDTATHAVFLFQEHNSDQFSRITVDVEPEAPHRIIKLQMEPIERPAEFPYGTLTEAEVVSQARQRLHALVADGHFSGVLVIQHNGATVDSEVTGEADRTRHIANTIDTRFRIGSMNKMFTAVATLQLVAAGKLQLDTPIGRYLPDYPNKEAAAKVTVRHLLTHTGGTGDFFGPEFDAHRQTLRTHEDFVALFGPRPLAFEPGSRYEYSNFGFLILGAIIDRVSGQSYYDYVQDHVYAAAGMDSTGSEPESVAVPRRAIGYTQADDKPWRPNDAYLPYRGASAGGGYTTAGDLLRFSEALQQHKLLDAKSTQLLLTPYNPRGIAESYGFGFQIDRQPSGVCFGHSGGSPGQAAMLEVCPEAGYTIVWLANVDPPGAFLLTEYLLHRLPRQ